MENKPLESQKVETVLSSEDIKPLFVIKKDEIYDVNKKEEKNKKDHNA